MADRYYVTELPAAGNAEITGSEAHHLLHVMRAKTGSVVELFDGKGTAATADVVAIARSTASARILERRTDTAPRRPTLTLATSAPKGDRFRFLVEKATELGVDRLVPLTTTRGVVRPGGGKIDKMEQTVIAACKQSGRNRLMQVDDAMTWPSFVEREASESLLLVAHPSGETLGRVLDGVSPRRPLVAAVGPEGGFTDDEIAQAVNAGARLIHLGETILRTETAAVAIAAILLQQLRDAAQTS